MKKGILVLMCLAFIFGVSGCTGITKKVLNQEMKEGSLYTTQKIKKFSVPATYEKKSKTKRQKMLNKQFSGNKKEDFRGEEFSNIFLCWWNNFLVWYNGFFE